MRDGEPPAGPPPAEDLHDLARDWITLWQSELAALAADREAQETWQALLSLWAGAAAATLQAMPRAGHERARPAQSPRPAAATTAPDARDAEIERLHRRLADLERRLHELERSGHETSASDRRGTRGARKRVP